jgi:hypothetical protein
MNRLTAPLQHGKQARLAVALGGVALAGSAAATPSRHPMPRAAPRAGPRPWRARNPQGPETKPFLPAGRTRSAGPPAPSYGVVRNRRASCRSTPPC